MPAPGFLPRAPFTCQRDAAAHRPGRDGSRGAPPAGAQSAQHPVRAPGTSALAGCSRALPVLRILYVCSNCFSYREHDEPALAAQTSVRGRDWISCCARGHSGIHGFAIHADTNARCRQWLTRNLTGWLKQFGRSGCGRCISWCPAGNDITAEVAALCTRPA